MGNFIDSISSMAGSFDSLTSLAKLGYGIYQDIRDYRYKKNLQNEIFSREDDALRRRMRDAELAGLNPYAVANGSGAGAGSVVGGSSKDIGNPGSILDTLQNVQRVRQAAEETKQSKTMTKTMEEQQKGIKLDNSLKLEQSRLNYLNMRAIAEATAGNYLSNQLAAQEMQLFDLKKKGMTLSNTYQQELNRSASSRAGMDEYDFLDRGSQFNYMRGLPTHLNGSPLEMYFKYNLENAGNSAAILQKQNNYFTADKWTDYIFRGINSLTGGNGVSIPQQPRRIGF